MQLLEGRAMADLLNAKGLKSLLTSWQRINLECSLLILEQWLMDLHSRRLQLLFGMHQLIQLNSICRRTSELTGRDKFTRRQLSNLPRRQSKPKSTVACK